jgi:hypothetical protein
VPRPVSSWAELFLVGPDPKKWPSAWDETNDWCDLKKSIFLLEDAPPLRRRAGETAESWKKGSRDSKISVNFADFGIIVRASQPRQQAVENGSEKCPPIGTSQFLAWPRICMCIRKVREKCRDQTRPSIVQIGPLFTKARTFHLAEILTVIPMYPRKVIGTDKSTSNLRFQSMQEEWFQSRKFQWMHSFQFVTISTLIQM